MYNANVTPSLSNREKQILSLLAYGLNQTQVAEQVFLSPHTVNFHVRNILTKLEVRNCTAAVAKALSYRSIQLNGW